MYEKIKAFCDEKKISVETFERLIDSSHGYIGKLRTSKPGVKMAVRIAQVMGITVEELFDGTD